MTCTQIALDRGNVIGQLLLMVSGIGSSAHQSVLFIHPGDHPNRSLWFQPELLYQLRGLHRDCDSSSVIYRTGSKIPRIQMSGDNHNLFGMLTALDVSHDVKALDIG